MVGGYYDAAFQWPSRSRCCRGAYQQQKADAGELGHAHYFIEYQQQKSSSGAPITSSKLIPIPI
ncbi:hypothetical protein SAY86_019888 [Trapa natans]|uniref:Uncharacterized protein n=1 Tax=Trapa natans TaxID=22666 RepID=A0AAN7R1B4_TRANT|nr:hypothetical protein SAY86_019888 [Trapa natans]